MIGNDNYQMYPDFTIRQSLYIPWHTDVLHLDIEDYELKKKSFCSNVVYLLPIY